MAFSTRFALLLPLVLPFAVTAAAAESVPSFNVEPSCKGGLDSPGLNERYSRCLTEEKEARSKLEAGWSKYPASDRTQCSDTARMGTPSYVELLTCLEMARDAAKMKLK
jgi:hypothetical protein